MISANNCLVVIIGFRDNEKIVNPQATRTSAFKIGFNFLVSFFIARIGYTSLDWLNFQIIHVGLQTVTTKKFLTPYVTRIYSSPTSISMYKYIHLHIDMGINLLSCVSGVRDATTRLLLIPNYNTLNIEIYFFCYKIL